MRLWRYLTDSLGKGKQGAIEVDVSDNELEHYLYLALVPRIETELKLEPCDAIALAGKLANNLAWDVFKIVVSEQKKGEQLIWL